MEVKYPVRKRKQRLTAANPVIVLDAAQVSELLGLVLDPAKRDQVSDALAKAALEFPKS